MSLFKITIDSIFGISLFINASLFIPQAMRILKTKTTKGFSLITFIGFCLTQLAAILYGYINHDYILMFGYILALICCGFVTILIFTYHKL